MPAPRPEKIDKGLAHFQRLKRSVEEASPLIAGDILLLLRVLVSDQSNWYRFVNSFDLLQPVIIDGNTGDLMEVTSGVRCVKRLAPIPKGTRQSLTLSGIIALKVLSIESQDFTIKALLNALAYSGDVHPEPSPDKDDLFLIKHRFLEIAPDFARSLILDLGNVLVASFEEVFRVWESASHLSSPDYFRQPQIVDCGKIIAPLFSNAFAQGPLRPKTGKGVRLILDYCPITSSTNGTLFALGHRTEDTLRLQINRRGDRLIFHVGDTQRPDTYVWSRPGMLGGSFRWIEVCTYCDGTVIAAVDGYPCGVGVLPRADIRSNSKLIVGADLHGRDSNSFLHRELLIDSVSAGGTIILGSRFSCVRRTSYPVPSLADPPNLMRRWTPPDI